MKLTTLRTATALVLFGPILCAQATSPDWLCLPSASGGWDCRDGATAATLPPRPPTQPLAEPGDEFMAAPSRATLERYMAADEPELRERTARAPDDGMLAPDGIPASDATLAVSDRAADGDAPIGPPASSSAPPLQRANLPVETPAHRTPVATSINNEGYLGGLFAARPDRAVIDNFSVWGQCGTFETTALPERGPGSGDQPIDITADSNEIYGEELAEFKGNVEFVQGNRIIHADFLRFNIPENELELIGNTYMKDYDIEIWGNYAKFDMSEDEGFVEKAGYRLNSRHAQGRADKILFEEHSDIIRLRDNSYSTCPAVKEDWVIVSETMTLDNVEQQGVARNATLRFKGLPVAWTPYMSFPLTPERKSGFLRPRISYGDETGADVTVPYYWNIAPNQDATVGVRGMTKRGVQLQGQYRYLFKPLLYDGPHTVDNDGRDALNDDPADAVVNNAGTLSVEYMPNDSEYDDYRAAASFQHYGHIVPKLRADINVNWASDDDYFRDLSSNLVTTATQFLERRGDLTYEGENWNLRGRVQEFQTLDPNLPDTQKPYKKLPEFAFQNTYPWRLGRAELDLRAEGVNWAHDERVEGQRYDIEPAVSVPFVSLWGYVTPKVAMRYTNYNLSDRGNASPDSINRFIPIASVDSGLFFERETSFGGKGFTHTLEPRLYYLYVKNKDQSDIPLFDTSLTDFSFAQLFQENRFNGIDRVGDANQVSLALTSRLLESNSGQERLSASIGQIYYFKDREVTLRTNGLPETNDTSEIAFGLSAAPGSYWNVDMDVQYSPDLSLWTKRAIRINYKRDYDHIVNLSYRRRDISENLVDVNQVGLSGYWGITNQWKTVTNIAWDLEQSKLVEFLGGIHYDTCCWSVMLAYRRFVNSDYDTGVVEARQEPEYNSNFLLMFELKGLGRYGQQLYDLMETGILGYKAPPETAL